MNGTLWKYGESFKTGHVIDNNGILILGQDQDGYGLTDLSSIRASSARCTV